MSAAAAAGCIWTSVWADQRRSLRCQYEVALPWEETLTLNPCLAWLRSIKLDYLVLD